MTATITSPTFNPESPAVAAAEARALAPLLVSSLDMVAGARLLTVGLTTPLAEVARLLSDAQIGLVLVCDATGRAVGVITETILVRQLGFGQASIFTTLAGEVMMREFAACQPADDLGMVLARMHAQGLVHVAVLDHEGRPLGVLNARDGLRALLAAGNQEASLLRDYVTGTGYR